MLAALSSLMEPQLRAFDKCFKSINDRSVELISVTDNAFLFKRPRELDRTFTMFSVGEYILRSAAAVEQTFGGLTTKLWDDPFEWTLPEKLATTKLVLDYLAEVEATREKGFSFFAVDADLNSMIPAPAELRSIADILISTTARAEHFQGRAFGVFQMFSDIKLPRL